ncbi:asparaginase domain-containing protein [Paracoccus sp. (in: a-proteobacteria)]|uniref:asparaginase domain-containing protein n=1 Tax=Paracoccus sp. TaxID=267 RepID=UPI003A8AF374
MRICILNTGGTISSVGTPLAPMSAGDFADAAQRLLMPAIRATLSGLDLYFDRELRFPGRASGTLDSTDLVPSDWCRIAGAVLENYERHDAFVILHGTDTMDATGAALPLLLNVVDGLGIGRAVLSKPVILTGAQLPLFRQTAGGLLLNAGSDAFANLCGALAVARLHLPEVGLFFDGRLFRANRALKVSTTRFAAFDSPHLPSLAEAGIGVRHGDAAGLPGPAAPQLALDHPQAMALVVAQLQAIRDGIDRCPAIRLPAFPAGGAVLARMIGDAVAARVRGIVIEGYGEGNVPAGQNDATRAALRAACDAGVIVVDTSQVIGGQVDQFHYAAGAWIAGAGAISGLDMTPVAAQAKLAILMAAAPCHGWDRATLTTLIRHDLAGECRSTDRLDSARNALLLPGQRLEAVDGSGWLVNDPEDGLALLDRDGAVQWAPAPGRAGRLILRHDGGLTLSAPDGTALWTHPPIGAGRALLILRAGGGGLPLPELHDAAGKACRPMELDSPRNGG